MEIQKGFQLLWKAIDILFEIFIFINKTLRFISNNLNKKELKKSKKEELIKVNIILIFIVFFNILFFNLFLF